MRGHGHKEIKRFLDDEVDADYILRYWKQYETANYLSHLDNIVSIYDIIVVEVAGFSSFNFSEYMICTEYEVCN